MKRAMEELAEKSGKPLAGITVFWSSGNYTEWLMKNTATVVDALKGGGVVQYVGKGKKNKESDERYAFLSLLTGLVLGTALGVIMKK